MTCIYCGRDSERLYKVELSGLHECEDLKACRRYRAANYRTVPLPPEHLARQLKKERAAAQ